MEEGEKIVQTALENYGKIGMLSLFHIMITASVGCIVCNVYLDYTSPEHLMHWTFKNDNAQSVV